MSTETIEQSGERALRGPLGWWQRAGEFLREVRNEMKRVTWPSQREVYATTVVVILTSVFFGLYLFGVDLRSNNAVQWLFQPVWSGVMTDVATKSWYIVHTYSGFEKKVAESLAERKTAYGLADEIGEILIPTEDVVEMRGGRKVVSSKRFFPGYILVEMNMTDNAWHVVKNTPKVTGLSAPAPSRRRSARKKSSRFSSRSRPPPRSRSRSTRSTRATRFASTRGRSPDSTAPLTK